MSPDTDDLDTDNAEELRAVLRSMEGSAILRWDDLRVSARTRKAAVASLLSGMAFYLTLAREQFGETSREYDALVQGCCKSLAILEGWVRATSPSFSWRQVSGRLSAMEEPQHPLYDVARRWEATDRDELSEYVGRRIEEERERREGA